MSVPPTVMRRVMRELTELKKNPPEGIRVQTNEEDMMDVTGIIQGPEGTPYSGGYFKIKFRFTDEFPAAPPKCWFATKIFHPNVSSSGEICVNTLKKDWKSTYGISHILVTVKCLLIYPNPESALDEEAGKLLLENYSTYCDRAKLITSVHATPRVRPAEFDTPSSEEEESSSSSSSTAQPGAAELLPSATSGFTLPISSQKSTIPTSNPKASLTVDKKDRHVSPSPLRTANANVGGAAASGMTMGVALPIVPEGTKAVKRAAASGGATNAEKRKKALKRL
ncbi:Ubiquitin-conjugating enzyme/RWD-like protein [Amanita muscaria]